MARVDTGQSFSQNLEKLQSESEAEKAAVIVHAGYTNPETKVGFQPQLPDGLEVRFLGDISDKSLPSMGEFIVFNPSRVEVIIADFANTDKSGALNSVQTFRSEGWKGHTRLYRKRIINIGWRPLSSSTPTTAPQTT